jgi:hypothetical protein
VDELRLARKTLICINDPLSYLHPGVDTETFIIMAVPA